jgi:hypothetical protein
VHAEQDAALAADLAHHERHVVGGETVLGVLRTPAKHRHLEFPVPRGHGGLREDLEARPDLRDGDVHLVLLWEVKPRARTLRALLPMTGDLT